MTELSVKKIVFIVLGFAFLTTIVSFFIHIFAEIPGYFRILITSWILLLIILGITLQVLVKISMS